LGDLSRAARSDRSLRGLVLPLPLVGLWAVVNRPGARQRRERATSRLLRLGLDDRSLIRRPGDGRRLQADVQLLRRVAQDGGGPLGPAPDWLGRRGWEGRGGGGSGSRGRSRHRDIDVVYKVVSKCKYQNVYV